MVSTGKAGSIEMALQGHVNICGSGSSNGISCCIQAGTAVHVDNYFDYLWVHRTPLPMGLHCQNPLIIGAKSSKGPQTPATGAASSVLPDDPFTLKRPPTQWFYKRKELNSNVVALFNRPMA